MPSLLPEADFPNAVAWNSSTFQVGHSPAPRSGAGSTRCSATPRRSTSWRRRWPSWTWPSSPACAPGPAGWNRRPRPGPPCSPGCATSGQNKVILGSSRSTSSRCCSAARWRSCRSSRRTCCTPAPGGSAFCAARRPSAPGGRALARRAIRSSARGAGRCSLGRGHLRRDHGWLRAVPRALALRSAAGRHGRRGHAQRLRPADAGADLPAAGDARPRQRGQHALHRRQQRARRVRVRPHRPVVRGGAAVVSGGVGTLLVVVAWLRLFPGLARVDRLPTGRGAAAPRRGRGATDAGLRAWPVWEHTGLPREAARVNARTGPKASPGHRPSRSAGYIGPPVGTAAPPRTGAHHEEADSWAVRWSAPWRVRGRPAHQRRRRDLPVPALFEVVQRVQQAAPGPQVQLPVDRLGRRHQADHREDRRLRRHRRPDDRRADREGARRGPHPDRARRGGGHLQPPGRDGAPASRPRRWPASSSARSPSGTIRRSPRTTPA